jgi:hydrogenase nickel incorporation protein HypA/HybF
LKSGRYNLHELSIAESLLDIIVEEARTHKLERIKKIKLLVGEFAAVVPESLTFCFELVSRDTIAEGAVLEIESVAIVARCDKCDLTFTVQDKVFLCPRCDDPVFELVSGRELSVSSIEGETGEEDGADQCSSGS